MRELAFWMAWLGIGFTIAGTLAFGMEQWQLTAHPVDEAADVESGLLTVRLDGTVTKIHRPK